jgi:hypothetical protein
MGITVLYLKYFNTSSTIHLFQHFKYNTFISTLQVQYIYFNTSSTTHLFQHFKYNTFISTLQVQYIYSLIKV